MKRYLLAGISVLFLMITGCSGTQKAAEQEKGITTDTGALLKFQDEVTVDFLRPHLSAFAADSMQGRETGTKGQRMAAEYLAEQYEQIGLKPVGDDSSYFQKFTLNATREDSIVFETYSSEGGQKKAVNRSVAAKNKTADFIQQFSRGDTLSGEIVFAGFGVQNTELDINQLQGIDLKGKWVMVFDDVPQTVNGDTLYQSERAFTRTRIGTLFQQGARGILMIPDISREEYGEKAEAQNHRFGKPSGLSLAYRSRGQSNQPELGLNTISPQKAANLLGLDGTGQLQKRRNEIAGDMRGFSARETGYGLSQITYESEVSVETENVLAFMEGADPQLKDEVLVMTSHYDHLGVGQPDSTGDRIYNGADDDGSGVIGMLNVAKAFAEAADQGVRPRRSILFLNVTGEEKGLLGSRYYSDHPVFPIKKTVANLNIDMIGRIDAEHEEKGVEDYSYIIGSDLISSDLDSLLTAANRQSGQIALDKKYNDLQDPNQFYRRSDHWNFGRLGVPFAFFFTGVHEDYHRPSDEVGKIRFEKMARIVRTMYATAVMVANADEAPAVDNQEFIEITKEK